MSLRVFNKRNNQKVILVIISLILMGVACLFIYKSYAIYEEKKTFDVIKGIVPNLDKDLIVAINVQNDPKEVVFSDIVPEGFDWDIEVQCDKGAIGKWNYDTWSLDVSNIKETKTKCNLKFIKPWIKFIFYENPDYDYASLGEFLKDTEAYRKVFSNSIAMQYLISRSDLISQIKNDQSYFRMEEDSANFIEDERGELIKAIISSEALSNEEKYLHGLPCYVLSNGESLKSFVYTQNIQYPNTSSPTSFTHSINTSINLKAGSLTGSCSRQSYRTDSLLDLSLYSYTALKVNIKKENGNNYSPSPGVGFGAKISNDAKTYIPETKFCGGKCPDNWTIAKISLSNQYAIVSLGNCRGDYDGFGTTTLNLYEWYLF